MQIIHAVAVENDIRTLTMPNLKMFVNAEWNTFANFIQKESYDHHVEASFNESCQFINIGCALKNKSKYQDFGMQFVDRKFYYNNVVTLSFRKVKSKKTNKISELVQDACADVLTKNFIDIFASSVQDFEASKVVVELNVEKVECNVYQGDEVGISAVRELTRRNDNVLVNELSEGVELMKKLHDMLKNLESNPTN